MSRIWLAGIVKPVPTMLSGTPMEMMDLSPATVKRDWIYARAWLLERMEE